MVSAASAWEILTKVRPGRLPGGLEAEFLEAMEGAKYELVPIRAEVALRAGSVRSEHRDALDRAIAAQALQDDIPVLSFDEKLDTLLVPRIW